MSTYFQSFARPRRIQPTTPQPTQSTSGMTPVGSNLQELAKSTHEPWYQQVLGGGYQSTSGYGTTPGIQTPGPYQQTPTPPMYPTAPAPPISPKLQQQIALQQARMGAGAQYFPQNQLATAGNAGWAQVNAQIQAQQQSEYDRQKAYEELQRAWLGLGQSPESLEAKRAAMAAVQSGGPWTTGLLEQGRGAIRNVGGVAYQGAQRNLAEELARRGMGGSSLMGLQQAQLGSQARLGIQQQLAQFEQQAAVQNEAARQAALAQLSELAGAEQAQRLGLDTLMSNIYKETQREPIDFSPVITQPKSPKRPL